MFSRVYAVRICQRHRDTGEEPNLVCLESPCTKKGLICRRCWSDHHGNHDVITINDLQDRLYRIHPEQPLFIEIEQYSKQIEQNHKKMKQALFSCRSVIVGALDKIDQEVTASYTQALEQLDSHIQLIRTKIPISTNQDFQESIRFMDDKIKEMVESLIDFQTQQEISIRAARNINQNMEHVNYSIYQQIRQAESSCVQSLAKISPTTAVTNRALNILRQSRFSSELQHADLLVSESRVIREVKSSSAYNIRVCVLGETVLDTKSNTIYQCGFSVKVMREVGYVGIASQQKIKASKFKQVPSWYQLGKGHYLLSEDGTVFSNSDASVNGKKVGFKYKQGDHIEIEFNTSKMELLFSKGTELLLLKVSQINPQERYRFVVYLDDQSDTVELSSRKALPQQ